MAKKKKAADRHTKTTKSFRLSPEIVKLLDLLHKLERRPKTTIIEIALEEYGRKQSLWPLPTDAETGQ